MKFAQPRLGRFLSPMLPLGGPGNYLDVRSYRSFETRIVESDCSLPECGIAIYNDDKQLPEPWAARPSVNQHISSHPFLHRDGRREYWH